MNRSNFVAQFLNYYHMTAFAGKIIIGDSSNAEHFEKTQKTIDGLDAKFEIVHRAYPSYSLARCLGKMQELITTPYAIFLPDDDLVVTDAFGPSVRFLDGNPDYSAAGGFGITLLLDSGGTSGSAMETSSYPLGAIEAEKASHRLLDLLRNYTVAVYAVRRTEQLQKALSIAASIPDASIANELFPVSLLVVQGKVKRFDCLFVVRQVHNQRFLLPDPIDWLTSKSWQSSYTLFRDHISESIMQTDGIGLDEAQDVVKKAFWSYLNRTLKAKWDQKYTPMKKTHISWRDIVKQVPGARKLYRMLRSPDPLSLPSLLKPGSPYHADFMPIYRALSLPNTGTHNNG